MLKMSEQTSNWRTNDPRRRPRRKNVLTQRCVIYQRQTPLPGRRFTFAAMGIDGDGASADRKDKYGATPLMRAARAGVLPFIRRALAHGAWVNEKNNTGATPLMHACEGRRVAVVRLLLARGADVNAADDYGMTALMKVSGRWSRLYPRSRSESGWRNHPNGAALARLLLDKGARVNARSQYGNAALTQAAAHGAVGVVRVLLERGADPNVCNRSGSTALMSAVVRNNAEIAQRLLRAGADTSLQTRSGHDALWFARLRKSQAVIALLEAAGVEG